MNKLDTDNNEIKPQSVVRHSHVPRHSVKPVIYQMLPRLFANMTENCVPDGDIR